MQAGRFPDEQRRDLLAAQIDRGAPRQTLRAYFIVPRGVAHDEYQRDLHEFGHMLGLPILYARPENPGSTGSATGAYVQIRSATAGRSTLGPWCKEQMGWLKPLSSIQLLSKS